jgi:hypothetical protein
MKCLPRRQPPSRPATPYFATAHRQLSVVHCRYLCRMRVAASGFPHTARTVSGWIRGRLQPSSEAAAVTVGHVTEGLERSLLPVMHLAPALCFPAASFNLVDVVLVGVFFLWSQYSTCWNRPAPPRTMLLARLLTVHDAAIPDAPGSCQPYGTIQKVLKVLFVVVSRFLPC